MSEIKLNSNYTALITHLKEKVKTTQLKAAMSVNREVISLYWYIGKKIIEKQQESNWGSRLIETLSLDLQNAFPETHGFSVTNLKRMKIFANDYPDQIGAQLVHQLPWGHIVFLIHKIKELNVRDWYAQKAIEEGWSRSSLEMYVTRGLYQQHNTESKVSNFLTRLPATQSSLAQEILKNPYNFDFLGLHNEAHERDIEHASIPHITKFLMELGKGFAYVGKQVPISFNDSEYFIDMLFYHLKLHCYVVIELKSTNFKPEHTGQLNFYLNLVDDFIKSPEDKQTIGLLLCKSSNKIDAEYALKGIEKPIGVSEYQLTKSIPEQLKSSLPSIAEIEAELNQLEQVELSAIADV